MPTPGEEQNAQAASNANNQPDTGGSPPSSSHDGGNPPSNQADDTGWGAARKAFFKDGELEEYGEGSIVDGDADDSGEADGDDDSHLEADGADQNAEGQDDQDKGEDDAGGEPGELDIKYNLDDLQVPHKFKPRVQQKIDAILADAKTKSKELNQGFQESNAAFARAFVDIVQSDNPLQTLHGYAKDFVQAAGMPQELLKKFSNMGEGSDANGNGNGNADPSGNAAGQATLDVAKIQKRYNEELENIENHYWAQIDKEEDPVKARGLYQRMNREILALNNAVQSAQLKAALTTFYGKLVKPHVDEFGKIKGEAERNKAITERTTKVALWDSADKQMGGKFKDWAKYRAQVKQLIKTKYGPQKTQANASGKGHFELMKDIYMVVARNDHLAAANRRKLGNPGLKPSGKHIKTQRTAGQDWGDIKKNVWGDLLPDYE